MTIREFKDNPIYTARMREIFSDPIMREALVLMKDGKPAVDAPLGAPEIMSVRILSQSAGAEAALGLLLSLQDTSLPETVEEPATYEPQEPPPEKA